MTEHYDYMSDEELLRHVYQTQDSTPLENLLAKRLERCMDLHEGVSESVYIQATMATKYPDCSKAVLERILELTAPPMGSQLVPAEGRAECDTRR